MDIEGGLPQRAPEHADSRATCCLLLGEERVVGREGAGVPVHSGTVKKPKPSGSVHIQEGGRGFRQGRLWRKVSPGVMGRAAQ